MGNQHGISFVTMKTKYVLFFTTFAFHQYIFTPTLFFIFLILLQQRNIHILFHWSRDKPVVVEEGKYDTRVVWWILMFWCMQVMCPNFLLMFSLQRTTTTPITFKERKLSILNKKSSICGYEKYIRCFCTKDVTQKPVRQTLTRGKD